MKIKALKVKQESIEEARKAANAPYVNDINGLEAKIVAEYNKIFSRSKYLKKVQTDLEQSKEFGLNEWGEVYSWIRLDIKQALKKVEDTPDFQYLKGWFQDFCIDLDVKNSAITQGQGESILINEDGDIYLSFAGSNKWIIKRKDYESVEERNELIEAWMETNGYFPGVFSIDKYGNVYLVNTQKNKEASNGR